MSITKISEFPLSFRMPTHQELSSHLSTLSTEERKKLEGDVKEIALKEGVVIEDWDQEWGQHHLFDDTARLVQALMEKKKNELFGFAYPPQAVNLVACHCPLMWGNLFSKESDQELLKRVSALNNFQRYKAELDAKYPNLDLGSSKDIETRNSAWKGMEMFFLLFPTRLTNVENDLFNLFMSIAHELLTGKYDEVTAGIILDRLLLRVSFHPTQTDLTNHLRLKELNVMTQDQIRKRSLQKAGESLWKAISIIPSQENKLGKFKPLDKSSAMKEVYASQCDRVLGFGMTSPTQMFHCSNLFLFQAMQDIKELFDGADTEFKQGNFEEAGHLRQRAFDLLNAHDIPIEARSWVFGKMYALYGEERIVDLLGEKLFYNYGGYSTSDGEKAMAIQYYLTSDVIKNHADTSDFQGSLQMWFNGAGRAYDLIVKDPTGGEKLKSAPKTLAHLYALLGMIKGSMDCSSGNTLVEYYPGLGRVVNFWDFDDERSMPSHQNFQDLRLWQLGLPQCAQPFDRATLFLFSDPSLLKKLSKQQISPHISKEAYHAQNQRMRQIIALFQQELLRKNGITLTPRDLFFTLFGGKEEFYNTKRKFNEDKTYGEEGIQISPIELFEFSISNMGKGECYTGNEDEKTLVGKNMRALYFPELS
ncbi:MAG: hypothetical protein WA678_01190 [Rhabdochlamydiaceae bacterium]